MILNINVPPAAAPVLPPRVKFGGYLICQACRMAEAYCACARQPPPPPTQGDGESSDLNRRIRDWKGKP